MDVQDKEFIKTIFEDDFKLKGEEGAKKNILFRTKFKEDIQDIIPQIETLKIVYFDNFDTSLFDLTSIGKFVLLFERKKPIDMEKIEKFIQTKNPTHLALDLNMDTDISQDTIDKYGYSFFEKIYYEKFKKSKNQKDSAKMRTLKGWAYILENFGEIIKNNPHLKLYIKFDYSRRYSYFTYDNTEKKFILTGVINKYDSNTILETITTLQFATFDSGLSKSTKYIVDTVYQNNPKLEFLIADLEHVSAEAIVKFASSLEASLYIKNYRQLWKAKEELEETNFKDDAKALATLYLIFLQKDIPFEIENDLATIFLNSSSKIVRENTLLELAKKTSSVDFTNQKIYVSGSPIRYKSTQLKQELIQHNITLVKKLEDADLIVVGAKTKLDTLTTNSISIVSLEDFIDGKEQRALEQHSNEKVSQRLKELLLSEDGANTNVAFNLMTNGGVPQEITSLVFAIYKGEDKKLRAKAKELLIRHQNEIFEQADAILKNKSLSNLSDIKKLTTYLHNLDVIDGFDVVLFQAVCAFKYLYSIGLIAYTDKDDESVKPLILKAYDYQSYISIQTAPSKHFLALPSLDEFEVGGVNETLWEITNQLQDLHILNMTEHIKLDPKKPIRLSSWFSTKVKIIEGNGHFITKNINIVANKLIANQGFKLDAKSSLRINLQTKLDSYFFIIGKNRNLTLEARKLVINNEFYEMIERCDVKFLELTSYDFSFEIKNKIPLNKKFFLRHSSLLQRQAFFKDLKNLFPLMEIKKS